MKSEMIPIGNGSYLKSDRIRILIPADAARVRRIMNKKEITATSPLFWDTTGDMETRSIIILDDGMMVLSIVSAKAISGRLNQNNSLEEEKDE